MTRTLRFALAFVAAIGLFRGITLANGGSVGGGMTSSAPSPTVTPAMKARETYNNGIEHRDKGKKLEADALKQTAKDREKTEAKAKDEFSKALKDFVKAADLDPTLAPAFNGMGYAYRKTGDAAKALESYDKALAMAPNFPDAIEYRGEAYLALNRVDDAKKAYMSLFSMDRKQSDELLQAMSAWVIARQANAAGVDPIVVTSFDAWVKERAQIAATTSAMSVTSDRSIWN